jgi:serine/threonine protein kinase
MSKEHETERTLSRRRQLEEIFIAALDVAPQERSAFLDHACAQDAELRQEVEELLEAEADGDQSLALLQSGILAEISALGDLHPSVAKLSLAPGMRLDRYELLRLLGQGGMGTVFLAHDTRLRRRVAIKILHATNPEMSERFLAEARATARCKHENIVVIHDVDTIDGNPYMVLECLEGESLRQRLAGLARAAQTEPAAPKSRDREIEPVAPAMPVAEALALVIPIVRALVCAHEHGIVHRDLKPENVFLCSDGTIKVLDFGIAKILADIHGPASSTMAGLAATPMKPTITRQGSLLGTLPYMAPEQWGSGDIDERTDLWALGIMLYETLAGRHPLSPVSFGHLRKQVPDLDLPMPGMGAAVPGLGELADIVDTCLRKRKAERMRSAEELLRALEGVRAGLPASDASPASQDTQNTATRPTRAPTGSGKNAARDPQKETSSRPTMRRWPGIAAALGLGLTALLLLGLWASGLWSRLSIPAFQQDAGGIVLTVPAGASDALAQTHQTLCAELRQLDAQAVRCVELPRSGVADSDLVRASAHAGASLIARLEGDHDLRLLPVEPKAELLSELPELHVADATAQQHLPRILLPLSRALGGDLRFDALRAPPVSAGDVSWRLAALAWYLNVLARNPQAIPPADLRQTMTRCRQEATIADISCALAHYVHTQLDPTPPDAAHWLQELLAHGPPAFADLVVLELASDDCTRDAERAQAAVLHLAARWSHAPCHRVTLIGPAACLLTRYRDASETLQPIAYPDDELMDLCPDDLIAAALAERGQWNMLARRFQQAARDFEAAWQQGSHPADLLNWAESLLHQRDSGIEVARPIAAGLDLRYFDAELRHLAAFLRWLATHDPADAAHILRFYSDSPVHASVLVDDESTLAALVCQRPEHAECRVHGILSRPKQPGSEEELRRLLITGDQR